jgi:hypothetical protein
MAVGTLFATGWPPALLILRNLQGEESMDGEATLAPQPVEPASLAPGALAQEVLVSDDRSGLTPAQMVERKLIRMLSNTPLPTSRLSWPGPRRPVT